MDSFLPRFLIVISPPECLAIQQNKTLLSARAIWIIGNRKNQQHGHEWHNYRSLVSGHIEVLQTPRLKRHPSTVEQSMLISAWVWPQLSALDLARDEPRGERADEAHNRAGEHAVGGGLQQKTRALTV